MSLREYKTETKDQNNVLSCITLAKHGTGFPPNLCPVYMKLPLKQECNTTFDVSITGLSAFKIVAAR